MRLLAKTIFEVEISNSGPKSYETATVMKMPASFAEFSDALQKARIKDGSFCKNELTCIHYNGLTHAMIGWNANLYDLNLFAQRLASLTEEQKKGMDALLKIKQNHRVAPIPLNQLINLTYNTDICCFAPRVSNHEELGAFLYANEMLSNEAMALLDTTEEGSGFQERLLELLGEQHQEDHGGVFTDFGYAELGGEIKDIYVCQSNETACFHRSDAPVVLEVRKGFFNDPSYDNDKTAVLNLPAADAGIWRAVEKVDAASVDECAFRCVDCLIPFLRDAINNAIDDEDGIEQADEFAKRLAQIEREWPESDMVKYKALLSVVDHPSLQDATRLMGEIDQYELRPEVAQTWGYNTLYHFKIEENRLEDGKYRIKGRHEAVNPISESLQKRFIDNGMPQEVLTQLVGKKSAPSKGKSGSSPAKAGQATPAPKTRSAQSKPPAKPETGKEGGESV